MNTPIKKILFPVDFSRACYSASRYVEALAGHYEAEVMLLHAIGMGERNPPEELMPSRKAELDRYLADDFKHLITHRICVTGDPAHAIAENARSWKPDLVMMPTRGMGYFRRHLLGSVTAKMLHDLSCPVWTSVDAENAPRLEDIHIRNVLCAVDLNEWSPDVLDWAAGLAAEFDAGLTVLYAATPIDRVAKDWALDKAFLSCVAQQAKGRVEVLKEQTGANARVVVESGDPATVIAAAARESRSDILVLGRHEKGVAGALFPHAYSIIGESPCPAIKHLIRTFLFTMALCGFLRAAELPEIVRRATAALKADWAADPDYAYIERDETIKPGKPATSKTAQVVAGLTRFAIDSGLIGTIGD